jgi:predicted phage terminase large subunit-like protein
LTPSGWRRHGGLQPGDQVFTPDGTAATVIFCSDEQPCGLEVEFSNGETIKTHHQHLWTVQDRRSRTWKTLETQDLMKQVWLAEPGKRGSRARWQMPDVKPIVFPFSAALSLHPYALGVWLGNGKADGAVVSYAPVDGESVVPALTACGYAPTRTWVQGSTGVGYAYLSQFRGVLRLLGLLNAKHIPEVYLRASLEDREQLLAGLIDTDGHVEVHTGRVRYSTTSEALRDGVFDLATTLGFRPYVVGPIAPKLSSGGVQGRLPVWQVGFQPDRQLPTRVPRKRILNLAARRRVTIVGIRPAEPEPGKCVKIDRDDGLYLVGRRLVPTHNTRLASTLFPAWYVGRNPTKSIVLATYNDKYAVDIGGVVKTSMQSPLYKHIFPGVSLRYGGASSDVLRVKNGGDLFFVGVGGTLTGRGGHCIVIDDATKNRQEADSIVVRDKVWNWYQTVFRTRLMTKSAAIVIIGTRWNEDDLIGRHIDPSNPHFQQEEADAWRIINLPALAEDDDPLGRDLDEPLWPERFDRNFLLEMRRSDPRGFTALYQCRPTPAEGAFFRNDFIRTYNKMSDLPALEGMRFYGASDFAVAIKQENDKSCHLVVGVDENENLWIMPDISWVRMTSDMSVAVIINLMSKYKPQLWFAEKGVIEKSIGPFLRKRMLEKRVYCVIDTMTPIQDKRARATAINARMSMGRVYFPRFARWYEDARDQLLKFPHGGFDDFVDTLSLIGLGLMRQIPARGRVKQVEDGPKPMTLGWIKAMTRRDERERRTQDSGWI